DVDLDVAVGLHGLQADQLGHDGVGDIVADRGPEEDDAFLEQLAVRIDTPVAVGGALLPLRDVVVHRSLLDVRCEGAGVERTSRDHELAPLPLRGSCVALSITWSMNPYSSASCGVK